MSGNSVISLADKRWLETILETDLGGKYSLDSLIGRGGMGAVYLIRHREFHEQMVLKLLYMQQMSPMLRSRLQSEAVVMRQLCRTKTAGARHIVEVHDAGFTGTPYIVMEYLSGGTLGTHISTFGVIPAVHAVDITLDLLRALELAHSREIIHRDIKPENIMFDGDGAVKLGDFGIAKVAGSTRHTRHQSTMGTLFFMPPEQFTSAREADGRSDIYSLGVCLWCMLHEDGLRAEQMVAKRHPAIEWLFRSMLDAGRITLNGIPESLQRIIDRATQSDPNDRYQTVDQMAEALKRCIKDLPVPPPNAPPFGTAPEEMRRNKERERKKILSQPSPPRVPRAPTAVPMDVDSSSLGGDEVSEQPVAVGSLWDGETPLDPPPAAPKTLYQEDGEEDLHKLEIARIKRRRRLVVMAAVFILAIVGSAGWLMVQTFRDSPVPVAEEEIVNVQPEPEVPEPVEDPPVVEKIEPDPVPEPVVKAPQPVRTTQPAAVVSAPSVKPDPQPEPPPVPEQKEETPEPEAAPSAPPKASVVVKGAEHLESLSFSCNGATVSYGGGITMVPVGACTLNFKFKGASSAQTQRVEFSPGMHTVACDEVFSLCGL